MTAPFLTEAGIVALGYHHRPRITVIVGDNAGGKTTLLEALRRHFGAADARIHAATRMSPVALRGTILERHGQTPVFLDDFGDSLDIRTIAAVCQVFRDYPYRETPVYLTTHAPYVLDMFTCESVCVIGRDDAGIHGVRMADIIHREAPQLAYGCQTGEQWTALDLPIERIRRCGALWLPAE